PDGTVAARLARGRAMLAKRLARRGLAMAQGVPAVPVPPWLSASAIQAASLYAAGGAAAGLVSAPVAAPTEGVLKAMLTSKLKSAAALLLGVLACVGTGTLALRSVAAAQETRAAKAAAEDKAAEKDKAKAEDKKSDKDKLQGKWSPA